MPRKESNKNPFGLQAIVTLTLSAVIVAVCGFLFIYFYKAAYNRDAGAGYFAPRDVVIFCFICVAIAAVLVSALLKIVWRHRLSLWILIALSVILPILCYQVNYHTLKKDGMLHFLVQEGGALHFVTIHDFDFDGVDDGYDYTGDDVREVSGSPVYSADPHGILERMEYTVVGKGGKLQYAGCEASYGESTIRIRLNKSRVTYEEIRITLHLNEAVDADDLILYHAGSRLEVTEVDEHTVSVTFDADTCAAWQRSALDESFRVPVRYEVDD